MLADASIHLTGILLLGPHLSDDNHRQVLARARYRSKREIEKLVAELAPRADVPTLIEPLHVLKIDLLEEARDLLGHDNPTGDFVEVHRKPSKSWSDSCVNASPPALARRRSPKPRAKPPRVAP